jgi:metal-dependent HD superfamily phosphatase/phosphodiesterase
MIHPTIVDKVKEVLKEKFEFPKDILKELQKDKETWLNYLKFSESYKRIRIAYIDTARKHEEIFQKRLNNFITHTKANKLIKGFGGIEKYY